MEALFSFERGPVTQVIQERKAQARNVKNNMTSPTGSVDIKGQVENVGVEAKSEGQLLQPRCY